MVKVNLSRVRESAREDLCASFGMELESGNKPRFQFQESRVSIRASAINDNDELEEAVFPGFDASSQTIECANIFGNAICQVTSKGVYVCDAASGELVTPWVPSDQSPITAGSVSENTIAIATVGSTLYYLSLQGKKITEIDPDLKDNDIKIYQEYFKFIDLNEISIESFDSVIYFKDLLDNKIINEILKKNKVMFEDFYMSDRFKNDTHFIELKSLFSKNKINIKFKNNINGKKNLDIKLPKINSNIKVSFDPSSSIENLKGKSKIKLFDNI